MPDKMISLPEAAALLRVPYRAAYDLVLSGKLPAERVGRGWQVKTSAVARLAKELAPAHVAA